MRETIAAMAQPPSEDPAVLHRKAQVHVLSMLAWGKDDVFELLSALNAYDVRHHFTPDVALLEVAASALGLAVLPGAEPLTADFEQVVFGNGGSRNDTSSDFLMTNDRCSAEYNGGRYAGHC